MQTSKRIQKISPSPTVALNSRAKELKQAGADVLNFAVGEPDFPTPKAIVDVAIKALQDGKTKYGTAGGGIPFRQAICDKLKKENHLDYKIEQVVCGTGAKELLFHIFLSMLNEGDEVILTAPCWVSYGDQIIAAGGVPVIIPIPENTDGLLVDPKIIEKYATKKTVAFVLCSPNNPVGNALTKQELSTLGSYLETKDWWVISDEIYEYFSFDHPHHSIAELCPKLVNRTVVVNGMSKGFAMTGWRVGYCAGPVELMKLVRGLQSHSSTCLPPFIEEASTFAIKQGSSLMAKEVAIMGKRRDFAIECIRSVPGVSYIHPQGAFYLFVDIRKVLAKSSKFKDLDSLSFSNYLLDEFHLAVVPGEAFAAPGFLRFSYAANEDVIKGGFERLHKAIISTEKK
jgi:aspartate aminotransferase